MSTKLYDGIILDISQDNFWDSISQIRQSINETFNHLNKKLTIEYLKQSYIESALRKYRSEQGNPIQDDKEDHGLFFNALDKWKKEDKEFFKNKLQCKVQIFEPLEDGRILGYVFTNNEEKYYENLLKLPFIKEFGYWNNTDKPEELTDDEWNDRYEAWNAVLDRNVFFTDSGITVEIAESKNRTFMMPDNDFLQALNEAISDEKNSWRKALSIRLVSNQALNNKLSNNASSSKDDTVSEIMSILHLSMDVVNNSDVLPVPGIAELDSDELIAKNTDSISFPIIDTEILDELVNDVEEELKKDG